MWPMRPSDLRPAGEKLVSECRGLLEIMLPLTAAEQEFIARLNDRGDIAPRCLLALTWKQKASQTFT